MLMDLGVDVYGKTKTFPKEKGQRCRFKEKNESLPMHLGDSRLELLSLYSG